MGPSPKDAQRYSTRNPRREVTFEYILLRGFNDSLADAQDLVRYVSAVPRGRAYVSNFHSRRPAMASCV